MIPGQLLRSAKSSGYLAELRGESMWPGNSEFSSACAVRSTGLPHESRLLNGFKAFTAGPMCQFGKLDRPSLMLFDETGQWNCGFGHFHTPNQLGPGGISAGPSDSSKPKARFAGKDAKGAVRMCH